MQEKPKISGIQAWVLDAYGTLFDVHSAVGKHRERLGDITEQVSSVWRTKQLEYTLKKRVYLSRTLAYIRLPWMS